MKIAYVHPRDYPSQQTNALQAIRMAAAFDELTETTFFMPRLATRKQDLLKFYGISGSSLRLQPMGFNTVPDRVLGRIDHYYDRAVALVLRYGSRWRGRSEKKVLFVRDPKELLFWGLQKAYVKAFRDWVFIFEGHSTIGLTPNPQEGQPVFVTESDAERKYQQAVRKALMGFDLVLAVTQALATALSEWTDGVLAPLVVRHASPLMRLEKPPEIQFGEKIIIGYIGQVSHFKGVDVMLDAFKFLPNNFSLRLVGAHHKKGANRDWVQQKIHEGQLEGRVEVHPPVPIGAVADLIDGCDILVQPASHDVLNACFEAPLKSFDYMVRGKPIVAADVPAHHELYRDGKNGLMYALNPVDLAAKITTLVNNPALANRIARGAWEQSAQYEYLQRAKTILDLVREFGNAKA